MRAGRFNGRSITGMAGMPLVMNMPVSLSPTLSRKRARGQTNRCASFTLSAPRSQHGVVLLIALIVLVAMTLAGIGMMRSVDTGNLISGNMAFRQATLHASDAGTSAGFNALMSVANSGNGADKTILDFNNGQPCTAGATPALCPGGFINFTPDSPFTGYFPGYFSTCMGGLVGDQSQCLQASNSTWWADAANWNSAPTVTVTDPTNGSTIATVNYLIHRMCQLAGVGPSAAGQLCQTYTQTGMNCSKSGIPLPCDTTSVFYRITSRSVGARNTVTYTQTLVLIAQ